MKPTTKQTILNLADNGFTFYAPVAHALGIKYATAEKYLKQLEKQGLLVRHDDGEHAIRFETSTEAKNQLAGERALARALSQPWDGPT